MFTGIIEELGTVHAVTPHEDALRLTFHSPSLLGDARLGESIAVNGCCLTVVALEAIAAEGPIDLFAAEVMQESLLRSTIGSLQPGEQVNLERAVRADQRLGGHIVQGHVDAVGQIRSRVRSEHWDVVEIEVPRRIVPLLVEKGSITVDGVSLTVTRVEADALAVSLVPATLAATTLGLRAVGEQVNLETDVIARHVAALVRPHLLKAEVA